MLPYKLDRTNDLLTSHAGLLATAQLRLCKKSNIVVPARETVQKTSLGYAGGKPNPLNPPRMIPIG